MHYQEECNKLQLDFFNKSKINPKAFIFIQKPELISLSFNIFGHELCLPWPGYLWLKSCLAYDNEMDEILLGTF